MRECICGHAFEDHEACAEGMLPFCAWCLCIGPKEVPEWIKKLRKSKPPQ